MVITEDPGQARPRSSGRYSDCTGSPACVSCLAAPTGRAAKRMAEATGHEAKTIHRLLEFSPKGNGGFRKTEKTHLKQTLSWIDETSMVDTVLMFSPAQGSTKEATIIFVGDVDQLPSVGAGNVLRDIIDSVASPASG